MHRVEIIAKKSGAHLGHVFNDAPGGRRRFCINATVLEFVPREKVQK
jgi:peptide methionine sulfoxide reductase msrA/msrB